MNGFKDCYCYRALAFFTLSLFLPIFDNKKRKIINSAILFVVMICVGLTINKTEGMVYDTLFYNSIYVDLHIGVLIAYIFYQLYCFDFNKIFCYISLCLSLSALIITKQISIVFVIMFMIVFILMIIDDKKDKSNKVKLLSILIFIIPFVVSFMWKELLTKYNISSKFTISNYNPLVFVSYVLRKTNGYETNIISKFINYFFTKAIVIKPFNISYFVLIILFTLTILIVCFRNTKEHNNRKIILPLSFFVVGIGFAYAMLLSYVYGFPESEAPGLIMYDRYMSLYTICGTSLVFYMVEELTNNIIENTLFFLFIIFSTNNNTIKLSKPVFHYNGQESFYTQRFNDMLYELDINNNLLIIEQGDILKTTTLLFVQDKDIEYILADYKLKDYDNDMNKYISGIKDELEKYEFIYLAFIDEDLIRAWSSICEDEPKQDHYYRVLSHDNDIKLEAINADW